MLRVLEGQFMRDILAPAGVVYDEVLKHSRWHALENRSFRARKATSLNPNSFRWAGCRMTDSPAAPP